MQPLRAALHRHPLFAAALLAAALLVRVLVPAGFMPMASADGMVLTLCSGKMVVAPAPHHAGMAHHAPAHEDAHEDAPAYESRCAFADLALPVLGSAPPVLLALVLAFVMARAVRVARTLPPRGAPYLRPPSRGPPRLT